MHARQPVPAELSELARWQAGVVTREQALGLGFGRRGVTRMVEAGIWRRLASGTYLTTSVTPSWESWAWSGVLLGGDRARVGGSAAGFLHGLTDRAPEQIPVLIPHEGGRPRVDGPWLFTRERPGVRNPRSIGSPPRLGVEDTVLDLAEAEDNHQAVVGWLTSAVQAHLTTPDRLRRAVTRRRFLRHRSLLLRVLADVEAGARSVLEVEYLREVERPHGLPVGRRQQRRRRTEVDVLYEEFAVLVELDGKLGHVGTGRFRDMRRDNASTTDGLATLRYGHADVFGLPCEVAWEVGYNLERRGWRGPVERCHRCRRVA